MTRAMQPLHTRAFDLDSARAGAPYALACGWPVEIFRRDGKNAGGPIMGVFGVDDRISTWRANGEFSIQDNPRLALVMVPLGYIDGKPAFVGDKVEVNCVANNGDWKPCVLESTWAGTWNDDGKWFRWPAPPKVYPVTGIAKGDLYDQYMSHKGDGYHSLEHMVNSALRHYIDNLTVLPDDCALRAKLVEMGWTAPDTSANWLERVTPANAKEGAR